MNRKQVNFDVRVFQLTANPSAHGGMTHEQMSDYVRTEYLERGWEVLNSNGVTFDGNSVYMQVSLVKYEDVEEVKAKSK
jgi:hypothetical protein